MGDRIHFNKQGTAAVTFVKFEGNVAFTNARFPVLVGDTFGGQEEDHGQGIKMRIFLTGVGCVGKTTIGKKMGKLLGVRFFDLDNEIESFFETSIERLRNRFLTVHSFRNEAAKALVHLLNRPESRDCLIALPPSGLMGGYLRAIKKANGITAVVTDKPENILERIRFYDIDSRPIEKKPDPQGEEIVSERD